MPRKHSLCQHGNSLLSEMGANHMEGWRDGSGTFTILKTFFSHRPPPLTQVVLWFCSQRQRWFWDSPASSDPCSSMWPLGVGLGCFFLRNESVSEHQSNRHPTECSFLVKMSVAIKGIWSQPGSLGAVTRWSQSLGLCLHDTKHPVKKWKTQAVIQMFHLLDAKHPDIFNYPDVWHQADQHSNLETSRCLVSCIHSLGPLGREDQGLGHHPLWPLVGTKSRKTLGRRRRFSLKSKNKLESNKHVGQQSFARGTDTKTKKTQPSPLQFRWRCSPSPSQHTTVCVHTPSPWEGAAGRPALQQVKAWA